MPGDDAPELQAYLRWPESVTHPAFSQALLDFKGGILPTRDAGSSRMVLIVKTKREIAVTARLRRFFRFYLAPLRAGDVDTFGLISAFFDNHDEPLVIRTPLFDDELTHNFLQVLSSDSFDIYFFDEYNRILVGFRAENPDAARFRHYVNTIRFVPGTLEFARQFDDDMILWFGTRSTAEDDASLRINLLEMPTVDNLQEQGQDSPGDLNEPDIEIGLHRAFNHDDVFRNPVRADNGREFVDVLVATKGTVLLIQAKDSPVTEASLERSIDRKKATTDKHVKKAAAQLKGSINHLRSGSSIDIITDGQPCELSSSGREVFGLVIVKELFGPERSACSRLVLSVFEKTDVPCLLLDYMEFQELTHFRPTEESLVGTLKQMFAAAREHGLFPRSRFGLVADGPTMHSLPDVAASWRNSPPSASGTAATAG
ncbi:hypothetical protein [Candidatus Poriferisodalis sp.]|uniref:hypothetical protein n=1 Tax=Candidatus Poriferisodalis sp. TaxID=3101277 RepID=UPI003C6F2C90